jgi:hypothetical protein
LITVLNWTFTTPLPPFSVIVVLNGSALESNGVADYKAFIYALVPVQHPIAWLMMVSDAWSDGP